MRSALPMYIYGLYSSLLYLKLAYITIIITIHYTAFVCASFSDPGQQLCTKITSSVSNISCIVLSSQVLTNHDTRSHFSTLDMWNFSLYLFQLVIVVITIIACIETTLFIWPYCRETMIGHIPILVLSRHTIMNYSWVIWKHFEFGLICKLYT
jgi:hypothetical protein